MLQLKKGADVLGGSFATIENEREACSIVYDLGSGRGLHHRAFAAEGNRIGQVVERLKAEAEPSEHGE